MKNIHGIDINLTQEREQLLEGGWEGQRIKSMLANIKEGDVVFDIGAEQGDMSVLLAKKTGKIVLMESSPIMWPHLRANFERNDIKPLAYYAGFASNVIKETPEIKNYEDKDKDGWPLCAYEELVDCRSFRHLDEEAKATKQITVDQFCRINNIYPNMVTIDVEGSEWHVLQGMTTVIDKSQPLIYVSIHHDIMYLRYKKWFQDIYLGTLKPLGYKAAFLDHDHESHFVFYRKGLIEVREII